MLTSSIEIPNIVPWLYAGHKALTTISQYHCIYIICTYKYRYILILDTYKLIMNPLFHCESFIPLNIYISDMIWPAWFWRKSVHTMWVTYYWLLFIFIWYFYIYYITQIIRDTLKHFILHSYISFLRHFHK